MKCRHCYGSYQCGIVKAQNGHRILWDGYCYLTETQWKNSCVQHKRMTLYFISLVLFQNRWSPLCKTNASDFSWTHFLVSDLILQSHCSHDQGSICCTICTALIYIPVQMKSWIWTPWSFLKIWTWIQNCSEALLVTFFPSWPSLVWHRHVLLSEKEKTSHHTYLLYVSSFCTHPCFNVCLLL